MTRRCLLLFCILVLANVTGCSTLQPPCRVGHDLLENPARSALIRAPAGLGALLGHAVAIPISVVLFPTWFFESAAVESCDVLVTQQVGGEKVTRGDIQIPLVQAPFEYAPGLGSAVLGQPLEWIACIFREPPGPPHGQVLETPEAPPGTVDPGLEFTVSPPRRQ